MPVRVACTSCSYTDSVADDLAGKRRKCPQCGSLLLVGSPQPSDGEPAHSGKASKSSAKADSPAQPQREPGSPVGTASPSSGPSPLLLQSGDSDSGKKGVANVVFGNWQGIAIIILLAMLIFVQIVSGILIPLLKTNTTKPAVTEWEYKIESPDDRSFDDRMETLGSAGWELVSARRATSGSGEFTRASYEMIFKRPKVKK